MEHEDRDLHRTGLPENPHFADQILRAAFAHKPNPATAAVPSFTDRARQWLFAPRFAYAVATIALLGLIVVAGVDFSSPHVIGDDPVELALYDMWGNY